ncbi:hypothetical protein Dtox_3703 [Desulfofarcimen acetoxidans DSM 771]|uniref:Uncharacterized protein n=1 Tax=Desulfofarcimen acetoxidans (strain ATCC 49208 / DSM 771 / KCTC 5769 / VKM B-1644 / 5575) TaxID=485916 RepID=C8VWP7_DESAS|nr:hypothetical protein [Desulfofarcimen acetoxidans]ACV64411.1 hypothetical protein Dtox_3703 [Desulfofarcimen acetoxidans DSM 771]
MKYIYRENLKKEAWEALQLYNLKDPRDLNHAVHYAETILRTWYYRSRQIARREKRTHPGFKVYVAAIMADSKQSFEPSIRKKLIKSYGKKPGKIQPGCSVWVGDPLKR